MHAVDTATIDARTYRNALGRFPTGLTIVTGLDGDEHLGFTCQSFSAMSIDPPLVSFGVMKSSTTYPRLRESGRFVVNILSAQQEALALQFARSGTDKWAGVDYTRTDEGLPVLHDTLLWLDCESWNEIEAGDHWLVVARVRAMSAPTEASAPLVYFEGTFRALQG